MPTRTRLTTPPGQLPGDDLDVASHRHRERYSPGLAIPTEPQPPARHRTAALLAGGGAFVLIVVAVIALLTSEQQTQDPALEAPQEQSGSTSG